MEAVGLALGIAGIAGSFKSCIDLFSYFSIAKSLGRDHAILTTMLDVEKALLLQWSQRMRLLQHDYDRRLNDNVTRKTVSDILASIQWLLGESSSLQVKYGLEKEEITPVDMAQTISGPRMSRFSYDFQNLKICAARTQDSTSLAKKFRWAISDREKFREMIKDLSHFVSKLNQAVPELVHHAHQRNESVISLMRDDIHAIRHREHLLLVRDATESSHRVISDLAEERLVAMARQLVVDRVWCRVMDERKDAITQPHHRTLQWVLNPPHADMDWDDLVKWLASGYGAYWVSGKAGSGKSTLMKYIHDHPQTLELLSAWAGGDTLITGYFFFWYLGTKEQKTQNGLSRALLYSIIAADGSLIPALLPRMWRESYSGSRHLEPPSDAELVFAFDSVARGLETTHRYCFLIDGLDEYYGNGHDGIAFIKKLHENPRIKVIVSSRPLPSCVEAFSRLPKLQLQDLTRDDVFYFVDDIIGSHPYMTTLRTIDPSGAHAIIMDITDKARGVFLWVVLACRSIIDGFTAFDSLAELLERVEELPQELEELFQHMLNKIDSRYHSQAAKILQTSYRHQAAARLKGDAGSPGMCTMTLAILENAQMNLHGTEFREMAMEEMLAKCTSLEGRLRCRGGGLLELSVRKGTSTDCLCLCPRSGHHPLLHSTVVFMHRTVFEFLDTPGVWDLDCLRINDSSFDPNATLALMSLHQAYLFLSSHPLHNGHIGYLLDAFLHARIADKTSADCAAAVLSRFKELTDLIRDSHLNTSCAVVPNWLLGRPWHGDIVLLIAVEAGMTNFLQSQVSLRGETIADEESRCTLPFLFHAIEQPFLKRLEKMQISPSSKELTFSTEMIRYLLSQGCRPNRQFNRSEKEETTPWRCWLGVLQIPSFQQAVFELRRDVPFEEISQIMESFILHGADLEVSEAGSKIVDVVIRRYFRDVSHSTKNWKLRTECGKRLWNLLQTAMKTRKRNCEELDEGDRPRRRMWHGHSQETEEISLRKEL